MKKLFSIALISFIFICCKNEDKFFLNGKVEDINDGAKVYLKTLDTKVGKEIIKDSAIVTANTFEIRGSLDYPELHFLTVEGVAGMLPIMVENKDIDITINQENISESTISGSKSQEDFDDFLEGMMVIQRKGFDVITQLRKSGQTKNKAFRDSLNNLMLTYEKEAKLYPVDFIKNNPQSFFSLEVLDQETNKRNSDVKSYQVAFENMELSLKNSAKGKIVEQKLDSLMLKYEKIAHLEIGKKAPNFEAPNPNGDIISLDQIKGKVTVIDFWAAWCAPCRRENPNVVRIYNKYRDQGLQIIGVSLDGNERQKDAKKDWLEAIEKDNLTWHQVSHLQYFNDPVARLYNITSIPATYILDENGTIVAKNMRGKALELKIEELLKK